MPLEQYGRIMFIEVMDNEYRVGQLWILDLLEL